MMMMVMMIDQRVPRPFSSLTQPFFSYFFIFLSFFLSFSCLVCFSFNCIFLSLFLLQNRGKNKTKQNKTKHKPM